MTTPSAAPVDWAGTPVAMAQFIVAQGEKYLQAQMQMAVASDQRAMTMAGVFSAIATATIAGAIAYWDKSASAPILAGGLSGGLCMLLGAAICLWSARQVDFYYPGNEPAHWYASRKDSLPQSLGGEAENYQGHIVANAIVLERCGKTLGAGAAISVAAPLVAVLAWWTATSLSCPA